MENYTINPITKRVIKINGAVFCKVVGLGVYTWDKASKMFTAHRPTAQNATFHDIPDEIIEEILKHLKNTELCSVAATSKLLKRLRDDIYYQRVLKACDNGNQQAKRLRVVLEYSKQHTEYAAYQWLCDDIQETGNPQSITFKGLCLTNGLGVFSSIKQAKQLYKMAVSLGNHTAMNYLGNYHYNKKTQQSLKKAYQLYCQADESGHPTDVYNVGFMKMYGYGCIGDIEEAITRYKRAAVSGLCFAQCELGRCYLHGIGVPKNQKLALEWLNKAAAQNFTVALQLLENYRNRLKD